MVLVIAASAAVIASAITYGVLVLLKKKPVYGNDEET